MAKKGRLIRKSYKECLEEAIEGIARAWAKSDIYYVGGYVRDEILSDTVGKDVDLVVDFPDGAHEFVEFLKANYPETCVDFVEYPRFGTAKFTLRFDMEKRGGSAWTREIPVECVAPRKEEYADGPRKPSSVSSATIAEDAMRRDFCCNALYKNAITREILDPTGHGMEDIKNKIIRTPTDPEITFKDDPLRMLRAIRFAACKQFTIEENTYNAIKPIPEYYQLSMERVEAEFSKIITCQHTSNYIWMLHDTGLLGYIIPELEEAWGFNQNSRYHSMNLTDHILAVADTIKVYDSTTYLPLILAALLHDISKYKYHETNSDGTFSYHGHEIKSAEMAEKILKRLKYSNEIVDYACLLIKNHMGIKAQYDYSTMAYTGTKKSMVKFLNKVGYTEDNRETRILLYDTLSLIEADNLSHAPEWNMPGQIDSFREKMNQYNILSMFNPIGKPQPTIVTGEDIMKRFSLPPGKAVGYLKDIITWEFQVDNPDYGKDTLLNMVEEEFGGDKKIYIYGGDLYGKNLASTVDPAVDQKIKDSISLYDFEAEEYSKRYKDHSRCISDSDSSPVIEIRAIEEPELYMRIKTNAEALRLVDTAFESLTKLANLPGFENIDLTYDKCNDSCTVIKWAGHRPTTIY